MDMENSSSKYELEFGNKMEQTGMIFRQAEEKNLDGIMEIISQAQEDLKKQNIDQWQGGYPNREVVLEDIKNQENYVLEESGKIIGTGMLSFQGDPSYEGIYEGKWKSKKPYGVIHSIAVLREKKRLGTATKMLQNMIEICRERKILSVRIDTHQDNIGMKNWLKKNGFEYCGVIDLKEKKAVRNAYERRL